MKLLLAGEGISETWRDYVAEIAGGRDPTTDFISLYGTADAGALGHESLASIAIRRGIARNPGSLCRVFGENRIPSLLQYYPTLRYFEMIDSELIFTCATGIPLLRYNIHDRGGVFSHKDLAELVREGSIASVHGGWGLPYVFLFGRSDFTTTLYGANIYPENIRTALESTELRRLVTGKFTMSAESSRHFNQYLLINTELAAGVKPSPRLSREIQKQIVRNLLEVNSEYRDVSKAVKRVAIPRIRLFRRGDPKYFGPGIKQRWKKPKTTSS